MELARSASRVVVSRGSKSVSFDLRGGDLRGGDLKGGHVTDDEILQHMLGPTGNLRAPTLRRGKTVFVGFNEEAFREALV